jgi:CRP-like cAMP-binding protein
MDIDLLAELKLKLSEGLVTKTGYVFEACQILEVDNPMSVDRQWLADMLGLSYSATTQLLHRLRASGKV